MDETVPASRKIVDIVFRRNLNFSCNFHCNRLAFLSQYMSRVDILPQNSSTKLLSSAKRYFSLLHKLLKASPSSLQTDQNSCQNLLHPLIQCKPAPMQLLVTDFSARQLKMRRIRRIKPRRHWITVSIWLKIETTITFSAVYCYRKTSESICLRWVRFFTICDVFKNYKLINVDNRCAEDSRDGTSGPFRGKGHCQQCIDTLLDVRWEIVRKVLLLFCCFISNKTAPHIEVLFSHTLSPIA